MKLFGKLLHFLKGTRNDTFVSRANFHDDNSAADLQRSEDRDGVTTKADSAADLQALQKRCGKHADCKSAAEFGRACKSAAETVAARKCGVEIIDPYSPAPKKSRFQRKLEMAMQPRCRKHKVRVVKPRKVEHSRSCVEAVLDDFATDPRCFGVDCTTRFLPNSYSRTVPSAGEVLARAAGTLAVAAVADVGIATYRLATARKRAAEREEALAARRKYYAAENAKRRRESSAIREAVPPPQNPKPTPEQLIAAYGQRHDSEEAKIRLGRLMIDLEEHVRYELVLKEGKIAGTSGGVREWMQHNCPELLPHYHTCQRFKRKVQDDLSLIERRD